MPSIYVRAANPIWYFVDLVGQGLNDQYYAFFLQNTFPYLPQPVFSDVNGQFPWPDPLQFYPNGTLPDNLYFNPDLVYRIEIRQGPTQSDPLIYEINNFVPGNGGGSTTTTGFISDNQISNSQFSQISFTSPHAISNPGTYDIAPGWKLILNGTGSATISQIILSGSDQEINDPPFGLRINTNGWSSAQLVQRFNNNGAIWTSTPGEQSGVISASITARSEGTPYLLTMSYIPSNGTPPNPIIQGTVDNGDYQVLDGSEILPPSDNPDLSTSAFIDITIQLQATGIVDLTNIQVLGQSIPLGAELPAPVVYQQETIERQIDHLFHYYANELIIKPKQTLLTGWNFSLNPFQFITPAVTLVTDQTAYIADQTILYQETPGNLLTGKSDVSIRAGLEVKANAGGGTTRFCLIQYIDPSTIKPYWSYDLSSLVRARLFTIHGTQVRIKMRLIARASLPPTISNVEPVLSLPPGGDPVFSAGWTEIVPLNDPEYLLLNNYETSDSSVNSFPYYSFNQFKMPNASDPNMTLAIVLYTMDELNSTSTSEDVIVFDKISLVPNKFAVDSPPETYDESLRKCEFYYEKSYSDSDLPGTATFNSVEKDNQIIWNPTGGPGILYVRDFELKYRTVKRAIPDVSDITESTDNKIQFYSPTSGIVNTVDLFILNPDVAGQSTVNAIGTSVSGVYAFISNSEKSAYLRGAVSGSQVTVASSQQQQSGSILYHYTVDTRLGI